jgi:DNA-binding GntR family transcriptional regulator
MALPQVTQASWWLYACPMTQRPGRPEVKYRHIAGHFRAAIEKGELLPGDLLPSQAAIQEQFGASMGTVVSALEMLRREGRVETEHGRGTRVLTPPPPPADFETVMKRLDLLSDEVRRLTGRVEELEQPEREQ